MSDNDLGTRYLSSNYLETNFALESPVVTDQSDQESLSLHNELNSMLDSLSQIINLEYRHRSSSEVFIPPTDFKDSEISPKTSYIQSLTESLHSFLQSGVFKHVPFTVPQPRLSTEMLELPKPRVRKDVISKLINSTEGAYLTQADLRQLAGLLIGSCRDSNKFSVKNLLNINKNKLEKKKKEFKEISKEVDRLTAEQEQMIVENIELKKKLKEYKQRVSSFEKQLVVTRNECQDMDSQCTRLRDELMAKRKQIQELVAKDSRHIDLRISISRLDLKIPTKMSIGSLINN